MDNERALTIGEQRFCDRLVETESVADAWEHAFGALPPPSRWRTANVVLQRKPVRDYLIKLRFSLTEQLNLSRETVLGEFANIAFMNIADFVDYDGETLRIKPLGELTRQQAACIKSITQDKDGRLKLEFHEKIAALDRIAKIQGWTQDVAMQAMQYVIQAPPLIEDERAFEAIAQRTIEATAADHTPKE